ARFFVNPPPALRVTELMYNPMRPAGSPYTDDDFEYIELKNTGATPLDLTGIRLEGVASFLFPSAPPLAAGARTVVVSNLAAFQPRYGASVPSPGASTGHL